VKITYFNKRERKKRVRGVILGQKLTLNHPSLVDEGEETRVLVTALTRERNGFFLFFEAVSFALFSSTHSLFWFLSARHINQL